MDDQCSVGQKSKGSSRLRSVVSTSVVKTKKNKNATLKTKSETKAAKSKRKSTKPTSQSETKVHVQRTDSARENKRTRRREPKDNGDASRKITKKAKNSHLVHYYCIKIAHTSTRLSNKCMERTATRITHVFPGAPRRQDTHILYVLSDHNRLQMIFFCSTGSTAYH